MIHGVTRIPYTLFTMASKDTAVFGSRIENLLLRRGLRKIDLVGQLLESPRFCNEASRVYALLRGTRGTWTHDSLTRLALFFGQQNEELAHLLEHLPPLQEHPLAALVPDLVQNRLFFGNRVKLIMLRQGLVPAQFGRHLQRLRLRQRADGHRILLIGKGKWTPAFLDALLGFLGLTPHAFSALYHSPLAANDNHSQPKLNAMQRLSWDDPVAFLARITAMMRRRGRFPAHFGHYLVKVGLSRNAKSVSTLWATHRGWEWRRLSALLGFLDLTATDFLTEYTA